jgi:hypothetical protein
MPMGPIMATIKKKMAAPETELLLSLEAFHGIPVLEGGLFAFQLSIISCSSFLVYILTSVESSLLVIIDENTTC